MKASIQRFLDKVRPYMSCEYAAIWVSISAQEQQVLRRFLSCLVDLILAWLTMLLDYCELSLNKAVDGCSAVWMGCVNCYVISSIKASLTISFCLTITRTLNSLRTWLAYSRAFLHPTMHQTRANPSRKWLQSQSKNRVKNLRSGMGVASLLNNRPFPSAQKRAKPGSVKAALFGDHQHRTQGGV